jgi:site-specific DNA-cytosine methylase
MQPLQIVSLFTGACSEAAALQALGVPHNILVAADSKKFAVEFVLANLKDSISHMMTSVDDAIHGQGYCAVHDRVCEPKFPDNIDVLVAGPPCQPFSRQREFSGRTPRTSKQCEGHPDYPLTMEFVPQAIKRFSPHVWVVEQVTNFGDTAANGEPYINTFVANVIKAGFRGGIEAIELQCQTWANIARNRPAYQQQFMLDMGNCSLLWVAV